jgi:hypothetical protein
VICTMNEFIESFNRLFFMKAENMHRILLKFGCMNKHNNVCFDLMSANSET